MIYETIVHSVEVEAASYGVKRELLCVKSVCYHGGQVAGMF